MLLNFGLCFPVFYRFCCVHLLPKSLIPHINPNFQSHCFLKTKDENGDYRISRRDSSTKPTSRRLFVFRFELDQVRHNGASRRGSTHPLREGRRVHHRRMLNPRVPNSIPHRKRKETLSRQPQGVQAR